MRISDWSSDVCSSDLALVLFCEINEDCTGFEQRERRIARPIRIDDRRNLVVRVDRQEILTELLVLRDVDRVNLVGDAEFLQQDRDFPTVRCAPGIELDGHWAGYSSGFTVVPFHSSIRTDPTRSDSR